MTVKAEGNILDIDGVRIEFDYEIYKFVELPDRIIVNLVWDDIPETDPEASRNVLAVDRQGHLLWRIEALGSDPPENGRPETWDIYAGINLEKDGRLTAGISMGFDFDVDPETGAVSNPVFTR